ncbi:hypothetical protein QWY74_07315 [Halomonas almeriensis]|uniref:hypothetical protein n=1 Tax=Halomonas almeriensis TaxID=308163 RepID=UPI0025B5E25F|nr:hypothetical protein [Halomonas almeriensis]MDN3553270.1 hypothetical protein [Halomonas almeriensis]
MNAEDRRHLNRAAFHGDAQCMEKASVAIHGIAEALRAEEVKNSVFTRSALLAALEIVAADLENRGEYVREHVIEEDADHG